MQFRDMAWLIDTDNWVAIRYQGNSHFFGCTGEIPLMFLDKWVTNIAGTENEHGEGVIIDLKDLKD